MALVDNGNSATAFITNALTGTVTRLNFSVSSSGLNLPKATTIASGYTHNGDPVALLDSPASDWFMFQARMCCMSPLPAITPFTPYKTPLSGHRAAGADGSSIRTAYICMALWP